MGNEDAARVVERLLGLNAKFEKNHKKTGVTAVEDYPTVWMKEY